MDKYLTPLAIRALSFQAATGGLAAFIGLVGGKKAKLPVIERWVLVWWFYDVLTHFTLVRKPSVTTHSHKDINGFSC